MSHTLIRQTLDVLLSTSLLEHSANLIRMKNNNLKPMSP
jgi:hypothetical protein